MKENGMEKVDPRLAVALAKAAGLDTADLERQIETPPNPNAGILAQLRALDEKNARLTAWLHGEPVAGPDAEGERIKPNNEEDQE